MSKKNEPNIDPTFSHGHVTRSPLHLNVSGLSFMTVLSALVQVVFQISGEGRDRAGAPPAGLPGEWWSTARPLPCEQRAGSGGGCPHGAGLWRCCFTSTVLQMVQHSLCCSPSLSFISLSLGRTRWFGQTRTGCLPAHQLASAQVSADSPAGFRSLLPQTLQTGLQLRAAEVKRTLQQSRDKHQHLTYMHLHPELHCMWGGGRPDTRTAPTDGI